MASLSHIGKVGICFWIINQTEIGAGIGFHKSFLVIQSLFDVEVIYTYRLVDGFLYNSLTLTTDFIILLEPVVFARN